MEYLEEPPKKSFPKKRLIALGIILLILFFIIFDPFSRPDEPYEEELESIPFSLKRWVREGEIINFSCEKCRGDIVIYFWDFDDGYTSNLQDPTHTYLKTGWYNVTLEIADRKGNFDTGTYQIGVQPNNVFTYVSTDKERDVDPEEKIDSGASAKIGPNIGEYKVVIITHVYEVVGECIINITFESVLGDNISKKFTHTYSTFNKKGEDVDFRISIDSEELPEFVEKYDSIVTVSASMDQGRWYWAEFSIRGYFYLKFLNPP